MGTQENDCTAPLRGGGNLAGWPNKGNRALWLSRGGGKSGKLLQKGTRGQHGDADLSPGTQMGGRV